MMDSIPRAITSAIIKIVIWVFPMMFLVKIMEKGIPLSYLRITSVKQGFIKDL